jgi:hypothetical protein
MSKSMATRHPARVSNGVNAGCQCGWRGGVENRRNAQETGKYDRVRPEEDVRLSRCPYVRFPGSCGPLSGGEPIKPRAGVATGPRHPLNFERRTP